MSEILIGELVKTEDANLPVLNSDNTPSLENIQEFSDEWLAIRFLYQKDKSGRGLSPRTIESYERDLKRLQTFLNKKRRKTFREADSTDAQDFIHWLEKPDDEFCSTKRYKRTDKDWKPFIKKPNSEANGLSRISIRQLNATVSSFYSWMVRKQYLVHNVFAEEKNAKATRIKVERHLLDDEIKAVNNYLAEADPSDKSEIRDLARQRWLWFAYLLTGLRISELLTITGKDISHDKTWSINVIGKGRVEAEPLTVPSRFIKELIKYRSSLNLKHMPAADEHLLLSIKGTKPVKDRATAHRIFKSLVRDVADHMKVKELGVDREIIDEFPDPESGKNIRRSSTHWLRHGFVTQPFKKTNDIATNSKMARDMDLKTTAQYSHAEAEKQQKILDEFADGFR